MNNRADAQTTSQPAKWSIVLAFAIVYLSWGTTYLAIKIGVEVFPPALFAGTRLSSAGFILLGILIAKGRSIRMSRREFLWTWLIGALLFVGGNGLITYGEKFVDSGAASVLVATTPLWIALAEALWPWGDRLRWIGWLGLLAGLGGVLLLLVPQLRDPLQLFADGGALLVVASSVCWAVGACIVRHRRSKLPHLTAAAYQMVLGGLSLAAVGLLAGEGPELMNASFTPQAIYSFFHLLVVGSLLGFVAYNWLLGHVSTTLVGTYAYVNPVVALLVGWLINDEQITIWIVGGMLVILGGVALVRSGRTANRVE